MAQFQSTVGIFNAAGVPGDIAFSGPQRVNPYIINSAAAAPNYFGYAYTLTNGANPDPASDSPVAGVARVGGSGLFAGILVNSKESFLAGTTTGGPLAASLAIADYQPGELLTMGHVWGTLPGAAHVGDLVTYDPLTGALNSIPPTAAFTASIAAGGAATADVLTVTAVTAGGYLGIGSIIAGVGVPVGTSIISLGTGKGNTGTYNISTINQLTVSSEAMTAPNLPEPAFSGTATFATTVMTVASVVSGALRIGSQVFGVGVPANTTIASLGTGVGGTGTYNLNTTPGTITPAIAVTSPANTIIPNAVVSRFDVAGSGLAVIKLTN